MKEKERINFEISTFEFKIERINTRINQLQNELKITVEKEITPMNVNLIESIAISLKELRREAVPGDFVEYSMGHSLKGSAGNYFGGYTTEQMLKYNSYLLAS